MAEQGWPTLALPAPPLLLPVVPPDELPPLPPTAEQAPLTQLPVQQSLSVWQALPWLTFGLVGTHVEQSADTLQPWGHATLQPPELLEQPVQAATANAPAAANRRNRIDRTICNLQPSCEGTVRKAAGNYTRSVGK